MYVCMCVCVCVCVCVCTRVSQHHVFSYNASWHKDCGLVNECTYAYICVCTCMRVRVYVRMRVSRHLVLPCDASRQKDFEPVYLYACSFIFVYIRVRVCFCVCVYARVATSLLCMQFIKAKWQNMLDCNILMCMYKCTCRYIHSCMCVYILCGCKYVCVCCDTPSFYATHHGNGSLND